MGEKQKMSWYNFVTGEHEYIETPEDFSNYLPQIPAAQNMYRLLVGDMGVSPVDAAIRVLEASVGEKRG